MKIQLTPIGYSLSIALLVVAVLTGCNSGDNTSQNSTPSANFDARYIFDAEPDGLVSVGDAHQSAQSEQEIYLLGRIGGSVHPFIDGLAAFTVIDLQLPECAGDGCCSPDELKTNLATVKFVNESGKPIAVDARELLNVDARTKVAVHGVVQRDESGNLTVMADKLYSYKN